MEDEAILELYAQRDEAALAETTQKFSGLCKQLAMRILGNAHDADECFDDMLLKVWNAIPPAHPLPFAPYLATLIRHICIDRTLCLRRIDNGDSVPNPCQRDGVRIQILYARIRPVRIG